MLRWMYNCIAGNWGSANPGFPSLSFETSCVQDLRRIVVHPFALSRFPNMLFSPLPFDFRWVGCPRRILALALLLLKSYFISTEAAHGGLTLLYTSLWQAETYYQFLPLWGLCPQTPGIYRFRARNESLAERHAAPPFPAAESALRSHPCVAVSSAQPGTTPSAKSRDTETLR